MIKQKLLIAAIVLVGALAPSAAKAGIRIELGDRAYYHGATYYDNDWEMIWVPGHWSRHHQEWIHGHYIRGTHHRRHWDRDRREDRREDRRDDRRYDDDRR
jgi:hypothetical protein